MIPKPFIEDVVSRTDIVNVIQSRVELKKRGHTFTACCPFHNEKTPSFTVSAAKQFYYCFGCGAHGNVIGFLMAYDHLPFVEAVTELAQQLGLTVPAEEGQENTKKYDTLYTCLFEAQTCYEKQLKESKTAIDYLKKRGLTGKIAKKFGIGYAPSGWDFLSKALGKDKIARDHLAAAGLTVEKEVNRHYDRFRDRIMFPIRDVRGRTIAFGGRTLTDETPKYLNSPETPVFYKNQTLYGIYEMCQQRQQLQRILVVEGYMDVVALAQNDIHYATATLGTALNLQHIKILLRYVSTIVFCFDGDDAGRKAAWKALTISLPLLRDGLDFRFLFLPQDEDPDSLIRKLGKKAFEEKINHALPLSTVFFSELEKEYPINEIAGKAAFGKKVTDYLETMPEGIYKNLLLTELAQRLQLPTKKIKPIAEKPMTTQKLIVKLAARLNPAQMAMQLLLHHPTLVKEIDVENLVISEKTPEKNSFIHLAKRCARNPNLHISELFDSIETEAERALIAALAAHPLHIPESGRKLEFMDALKRLREHNEAQQLSDLIEKSKISALEETEKQRLKELLSKRAE